MESHASGQRESLVDHSASELVYTSSIDLKIKNNCNVRLGPLAYITSDLGFDFGNKKNNRPGPMEHRMMEGVYLVHRVKKTIQVTKWRQRKTDALFTVITLQDLDPRKIVDTLETFFTVSKRALDMDLFFDNRRWMQFVGKRLPVITDSHGNRKKEDVTLNSVYGRPTRDVLMEKLAMAAYTCQLCWSNEICDDSKEYIVREEDMIHGDVNTFYIRQLSKPLDGKLRIELSSPDMTEFSLTAGKHRTPSIVGIYHHNGQHDGVCGHVLYTDTDLEGNNLPRERVFAVVLGSAFDTRTVAAARAACVARSGCGGVGCVRFRNPIPCSDFLYDKKTSAGDFGVSPSEKKGVAESGTTLQMNVGQQEDIYKQSIESCYTKTPQCRKRKHAVRCVHDHLYSTRVQEGSCQPPKRRKRRLSQRRKFTRKNKANGLGKSNRFIAKQPNITPCPTEKVTENAFNSVSPNVDDPSISPSLDNYDVCVHHHIDTSSSVETNTDNDYIPFDLSSVMGQVVADVEIRTEEEKTFYADTPLQVEEETPLHQLMTDDDARNISEELAEFIIFHNDSSSLNKQCADIVTEVEAVTAAAEDTFGEVYSIQPSTNTLDSFYDGGRSIADLVRWLSSEDCCQMNEKLWLDDESLWLDEIHSV